MSIKTSNRKSGPFPAATFNTIAYLLCFGVAVVLFIAIDPAILSGANALSVALWVSLGAAFSGGAVSFLATGRALHMPKTSAIPRFLLTSGIVALSSIAFWAVSLEASMLMAAIAQPLRVIAETSFAGAFMTSKKGKPRWDRMAFDAAMGFILMGFVITSGQIGNVSAAMAFLMVAGLILVGTASELFLVKLQLKENDDTVHPASKVGTINLVLTLIFLFFSLLGDTTNLFVGDLYTSLLLMAIGAIGATGPTVNKLLLVRAGYAAQDVSILALGFSGAVSFVTLVTIALVWLVSFAIPMPSVLAALIGQLGSATWVWVSMLISVFVLTRFWAEAVPDTPNDPNGGGNASADNNMEDNNEQVNLSIQNSDWLERTHPAGAKAYVDAEHELRAASNKETVAVALNRLATARKLLGHAGFKRLPTRLLVTAKNRAALHPAEALKIRDALITFDGARKATQSLRLHTGSGRVAVRKMEMAYRNLLLILYGGSPFLPLRLLFWASRMSAFTALTSAIISLAAVAGTLAALSRRLPGKTGLEIWGRGFATVLERFASVDALMTSGLEASVGFRLVIPGTGGLIANAGFWVMVYSGSLTGYLNRSNPMLFNPGFTLATPIWIATWNRPGLGMGPSLPFGNAYLDSQRYKLLLGADGVGYVRIGHWEGRGAYGTVSGSFPLMLGLRGTWNTSLFSPGLKPIVQRSTPLARWMRAKSAASNDRIFGYAKRKN